MDLIVSLVLFVMLLVVLIVLFMPGIQMRSKLLSTLTFIIFSVVIISIGNSTWNLKFQIQHELQSGADTRGTIQNNVGLPPQSWRIQFESSKKLTEMIGYTEIVKINDQRFMITALSYEDPIGWTPFQVWHITKIDVVDP